MSLFYDHQEASCKVRELYPLTAIGEFDPRGFYKRAEIDGVNVKVELITNTLQGLLS